VIATTSPLVWYTTRATGVVAIVLLTTSMVLGILTTTRIRGRSLPGYAVSEVHNRISLLGSVFVVIHVLTAIIDTYVPIGIAAAVVPFASSYRPLPVALGTVGFDLLLAVCLSSVLRRFLSAGAWRSVHWLVYLSWPLAFAHGIVMGSDMRFGWMQLLSALCGASMLVAVGWRLWANPRGAGVSTALPYFRRSTGPVARSADQFSSPDRTRLVGRPLDPGPPRPPFRRGQA
jgi:sulfoxide reductase heme-binding subunit YedZ